MSLEHKTFNKPTVSVIVTAFNRAKFLSETIQSVLNQTFNDIELLIIDDGSTDNTSDVVNSFSDARIKYYFQENSGQNAAKNRGFLLAKGKYITILDSDDVMKPQKLEKQVTLLEQNNDCGVCFTGVDVIDENGHFVKSLPLLKQKGDFLIYLLEKNYLYNGSNALYRRECLEKTGLFSEKVQRMTDWDLYLRMALYYKFDYIDENLLNYRVHSNNMSMGFKNYERAGFTILKRIFSNKDFPKELRSLHSKVFSLRYSYMADRYLGFNKSNRAKKYIMKSFKLYPKNIFKPQLIKIFLLSFLSENLLKNAKIVKEKISNLNIIGDAL